MIGDFLIVLGVAVLSMGLRTFQHPAAFRAGTLGVVATSFLAGWLLGGSLWLGGILAASWLLLPWLEILTRVRRLRLPIERTIAPRRPPTRGVFPGFGDLTDEVEAEGFEYLEDAGWNHEDTRHFYRIFAHHEKRMVATICLAEQSDFAFYYLSVTTRTADGRLFLTWNYPFSYGLKLPPEMRVRRFSAPGPFAALLQAHGEFLATERVAADAAINQQPEEILRSMQNDLRGQITHNIAEGLLRRESGDLIRYTVRGMFYLWLQFLRDLVRIS